MSGSGPLGAGDPFEGIPFFADLARMIARQGPVSWDAARQLALSVATGGESEPNVDPIERTQIEQLARVADLHVSAVTGLATSATGRAVTVVPVTRSQWVLRALEVHRPLIEALATTLAEGAGGEAEGQHEDPEAVMGAWLGGVMQMLTPMMLGMTAGSMVGHLALKSFGEHDLPLPRPPGDEIQLILRNIDEFASAWVLDRDELRLWVCLHEVAHHAVLLRPHVRDRLEQLLLQFTAAFQPDTRALEERLADIDLEDAGGLAALQSMLSDPQLLVGAIRSPAQRDLVPRLEAVTSPIVGYVDWVMDSVGERVMHDYVRITEAMRRNRVEASPADRFVGALFGLDLDQGTYERGRAFVEGVVERAGTEGLTRLWSSERELPTPAEVDAPGLWLARIELPDPPSP